MKALWLAVTMAVGLDAATAQAEPAADAPAAQKDERVGASTKDAARAQPEVSGTAGVSEPRGELVRLSRLPEAELMVDVSITSNDERAYFEVNSDKTGASLLICGSPCKFRVWPGRYRLITNASSSYVGGSNQFVVERNSKIEVFEPRVHRLALGALVGTLGLISAVIGGLLLTNSFCDTHCDRTASKQDQMGMVTLGAGLVMAPAGWILFAQNRNPDLSVSPHEPEKRE